MPILPWGTGRDGKEGLPSLEEWLELELGELEDGYQIVKVTRSQKYKSYNFECLTDGKPGFRTSLYESHPDYERFGDQLKEWRENGIPLYLIVTDHEWGHWQFGTDESKICHWTKKGNGYICSNAEEREEETNE